MKYLNHENPLTGQDFSDMRTFVAPPAELIDSFGPLRAE